MLLAFTLQAQPTGNESINPLHSSSSITSAPSTPLLFSPSLFILWVPFSSSTWVHNQTQEDFLPYYQWSWRYVPFFLFFNLIILLPSPLSSWFYVGLKAYLGKELGVTDYFHISQDRINAFADATGISLLTVLFCSLPHSLSSLPIFLLLSFPLTWDHRWLPVDTCGCGACGQRVSLWRVLSLSSSLFVLFCFVLFCFVLFCFVLFCFVLFIYFTNRPIAHGLLTLSLAPFFVSQVFPKVEGVKYGVNYGFNKVPSLPLPISPSSPLLSPSPPPLPLLSPSCALLLFWAILNLQIIGPLRNSSEGRKQRKRTCRSTRIHCYIGRCSSSLKVIYSSLFLFLPLFILFLSLFSFELFLITFQDHIWDWGYREACCSGWVDHSLLWIAWGHCYWSIINQSSN